MNKIKVKFWDDDRSIGDCIFVTLAKGYKFASDPLGFTHIDGFDTVRDAKRAVKNAIVCMCAECKDPKD